MKSQIQNFSHWIFDMDGTLTVACHDFDDIRSKLGLPAGVAILEALAVLPESESSVLHDKLFEFEMQLAHEARPQPGAAELLERLVSQGHKLGILTRNSLEIAYTTLQACGLRNFFQTADILGRESCAPKPDPAGVFHLMQQWGSLGKNTVMVGDYVFDLQSGHAAGAHTIHFDVGGSDCWPEVTHFRIAEFSELTQLLPD